MSIVAGGGLFALVFAGMTVVAKSIDRQPDLAFAYIVRGNFRAELVGDRNGAIADYSQVIQLEPERALGYYLRAKNRFKLGDPKGAIDDFDRAIQLQPNYVNAYLSRGVVRASLGDRQGAIDDTSQAIRLGLNPDR